MTRRLSKDEAKWNDGWRCDICRGPVDRFKEATYAPAEKPEVKICRHWRCHTPGT